MATLAERVRAFSNAYGLLPEGDGVLALVSGGPDSTALLYVLIEIHTGPLAVLSFDHGLRDSAATEAAAVVRAAEELGVRAEVIRLSLVDGANLQSRARDARYEAAQGVAERLGCAHIATGHTLDDQAETVLFRIARGTGRTGALGLAPRNGRLIRPFLCISRADTVAFCKAAGLDPVQDPSNTDRRFTRTRVRSDLMGALREIHPGAELQVARFAETLRDESEVLDGLLDGLWERCRVDGGLSYACLHSEPIPLARLALRRLASEAGAIGIGSAEIERILALTPSHGPVQLPGGYLAACDADRIRIEVTPGTPPDAVTVFAEGDAAWGEFRVEFGRGIAARPTPECVPLSPDAPLVIRGARPGDRIGLGAGGNAAVSRVLADRGVPVRWRPWSAVLEQGGQVVWVLGQRAVPDLLAPIGADAIIANLRSFPAHGVPRRRNTGQ